MMHVTRRTLTSALLTAAFFPGLARAQSSTIMVVNANREFDDILRYEIDDTMRSQHRAEVLHDASLPREHLFGLIADENSRKETPDVLCLDEFDMDIAARTGALEEISSLNVPRIDAIRPSWRKKTSVVSMGSAQAIVYNPSKVPDPPRSLRDLWSSKYRNRIGLADTQLLANVIYAAVAGDGSVSDISSAEAKLRQWRSLGAKIFASDEAIASALSHGDIWLTIAPVAHAYIWERAGIPIDYEVPQEGTFISHFEAAVPKSARNKAKAFEYLNLMLEPASQARIAKDRGFSPSVRDVSLDGRLADALCVEQRASSQLWQLDAAHLADQKNTALKLWKETLKI